MSEVTATCATCGTPVNPDDQFCESCGATLAPPVAGEPAAEPQPEPVDLDNDRTHQLLLAPTAEIVPAAPPPRKCAECGADVAPDGYCTVCGARAAVERDHWLEQPAPWVGAVCDRGLRHPRNEDGMATAADAGPGTFCAMVVCDGVSTSTDSDVASLAAAIAARDVLVAAHGEGPTPDEDVTQFWTAKLQAAGVAAGREAVAAAKTVGETPNPPSCTFVAAVVDGPVIVAGCVGDSRAYWLPDDGAAVQLTSDDSWVTAQVELGVPREVAEAAPQAHGITRWLGVDSPDDSVPACSTTTADRAGWLLVCSDGLWNYCSAATDLRDLVTTLVAEHGDQPDVLAGALVDWSNAQGGHDNITAALARVPSPTTGAEPDAAVTSQGTSQGAADG